MLFSLTPQSRPALAKALEQMTGALEILDEVGAPGEIGATLDLAIARLRTLLGQDELAAMGIRALNAQLEYELSRLDGEPGARPERWEIPPV